MLKAVGNGIYQVSDEFIQSNPSKEQVAQYLCNVANNHLLAIDDTYAWDLAGQIGLTKEDFFDDQEETIRRFDEEAITHYGIVNWKYKPVVKK